MFEVTGYRLRAEECARRASEAQDDFHKKNFSQLAKMWTEMADKAETRELKKRRETGGTSAPIRWAKAS